MKKFRSSILPERVAAAVWTRIRPLLTGIKVTWARRMDRMTRGLSSSKLKGLLLLFCLIAMGTSIYNGLSKRHRIPGMLGSVKRSRLVRVDVYDTIASTGEQVIYGRISRFSHYIDDLQTTADGKRRYDSIIMQRPGLLDSLRLFQSLYEPEK